MTITGMLACICTSSVHCAGVSSLIPYSCFLLFLKGKVLACPSWIALVSLVACQINNSKYNKYMECLNAMQHIFKMSKGKNNKKGQTPIY